MASFLDILISLYTREALICRPFQRDFQGINIINIAATDIVLDSEDAESYIDFKTDNAF